MAEEEGFEPPVPFPVHRISSAAHSATLALFLAHYSNLQEYRELINCVPISHSGLWKNWLLILQKHCRI